MTRQRFGAYDGGPDPLAGPSDVREAVDALGDAVLAGEATDEALRELLRGGLTGRGLDAMLRQVRRRQQELRSSGRLDGTVEQVRTLLDTALEAERAALFPDPGDDARFREAVLDALPNSTAQAVRELSPYQWRSPDAQAAYDAIGELLRREVVGQQFAGMKQMLRAGADAAIDQDMLQHVRDMLSDLNTLLDKRLRGADTAQDFAEFMRRHGDLFPSAPQTLDELLEELARRSAALDRMLKSLSPEQADELASLIQQAGADLELSAQLSQLGDNLRALRPDLFRQGRERMRGAEGLGVADATDALADLADLDALAEQLAQGYAGARLDDVDEQLVRRALGRGAVDDLDNLRRIERELSEQGYLVRRDGKLELTPKAVRRLGQTALRRVFADLSRRSSGQHDLRSAGAAGEATGSSRAWQFGDEQPLDVVRTLSNAVRRGAPLRLVVDDFEVHETERRSAAAVCLLVDSSWSMVLNGTWGEAKQTALALHTLVDSMYPQDAMQVVAFSDLACELHPHQLAGLDFAPVQGTNLQHALLLAGRFLDRHPGHDPVVLIVTDGEPTARLRRDGTSWFSWPADSETLAQTVAQVDAMTRRGAVLNVFVLGDDPRLRRFVDDVAQRNGGRVFAPQQGRLGEYVVRDFVQRRRALRAR